MEWLFIFGLVVWTGLQSVRLGDLSRELKQLRLQLAKPAQPAVKPASAAPNAAQAPAAVAEPPLLLTNVVRDDEYLLDMPLPLASNDDEAPEAPASVKEKRESVAAGPPQMVNPAPASALGAAGHPAPAAPAARREFERWLAENGLAWAGGGAATLAVIFFITLMAQQGWFTPPVRLLTSTLVGGGLILAGERLRRLGLKRPPGHPLAAALCAGAGIVAFYGTVWAAHGLHHLIGLGAAAALLTLCALAAIGLSFLHGQALGVLAIGAALLAPALTDLPAWPGAALGAYVCATAAAGFALAFVRRWAWTAAATLAGLYFWFAASLAADEIWRALTLLAFAAGGGVLAARFEPAEDEPHWRLARQVGPSLTVCGGAVLSLWTWAVMMEAARPQILGPALINVFLVGLAAYAVRARAAGAEVFSIAVAATILALAGFAVRHGEALADASDFYAVALTAAAAIAFAAFVARPSHRGRALIAVSGAAGFALASALAAATRSNWSSLAAWAPLFIGAAAMLAAAMRAARQSAHPERDIAVDAWVAAGAALLLLGVQSAVAALWRPLADALAAMALAYAFARFGWRAAKYAAISAAALALLAALAADAWRLGLTDLAALGATLALSAASAIVLFAGARHMRRRGGTEHEALSSAAALALLSAAFLALSFFASGEGAPLGALSASALNALALLAAGAVLTRSAGTESGFLARWRGHALTLAGLGWALLRHGFEFNPWWGLSPAVIAEPVLFNTLALALAAPAAFALAAARRTNGDALRRMYKSAALVLGYLWITIEVRHLFQGANMTGPSFMGAEGYVHSLWPLAAFAAGAWLNGAAAARRCLPALILAAIGLWIVFNPWWGIAPARTGALTSLAALAFAAWASASVAKVSAAEPSDARLRPFSQLMSFAHLLVAATLAVRYGFHGGALASAPTLDVELWSYSAVWALYGGAAFWLGARRDDGLLRWCGLALLVGTTAWVAFLAFTRLNDLARVGSLLGLAIVLLAVTWIARTQRAAA